MSLPLKRRIAQAALIVAAGATPLVAAGSAFAAADLVPHSDLGAPLTQLAAPDASSTLQHTTHELGNAAGATGAATVATGVPATTDATGNIVAGTLPEANQKTGSLTAPVDKTAATTGELSDVAARVAPALTGKLGQAAAGRGAQAPVGGLGQATGVVQSVPTAGALTDAVPGSDTLTGALPTDSLPTSALPTSSLTRALPGTELLGLGEHGGANRLGGVPDLGGSSPLSSLTNLTGGLGALGPVGGLLGGLGGGSLGG